jgi:hypothetical protein
MCFQYGTVSKYYHRLKVMDATNWLSMTTIFRQMDLWWVLVSYNEWTFPNLSQAFNFRRTNVIKTIVLLAGPFNDSNIDRIYHKKIQRRMSIYRKQAACELFYRQNSGPLPDDISSRPPCTYLNQDSNAFAIITKKTISGSCPNSQPPHKIIWTNIQLYMCPHHQPPKRPPNRSTTVLFSSMEHNAHAKLSQLLPAFHNTHVDHKIYSMCCLWVQLCWQFFVLQDIEWSGDKSFC